MENVIFLPAGDCALCVEFGNAISPELNEKVQNLAQVLEQTPLKGMIETVPTFRSLLIQYNPSIISYSRLCKKLQKICEIKKRTENKPKVHTIPVCYDCLLYTSRCV